MLVPPLAVLLGLEDGLHLRVAGGSIHLLFCCAFLCQRVSSLIARHVAVRWYPVDVLLSNCQYRNAEFGIHAWNSSAIADGQEFVGNTTTVTFVSYKASLAPLYPYPSPPPPVIWRVQRPLPKSFAMRR